MHGTMRLFLAFGVLGTTMSTEFVQMGSGPWGYGYNDCKVACASYSDSTSLAGDWRLPCITSASVEFDFNAATSSYAVDGYPAPGNGPTHRRHGPRKGDDKHKAWAIHGARKGTKIEHAHVRRRRAS